MKAKLRIGNLIKLKPHEDGRVRIFPIWQHANNVRINGREFSSESLPVMIVKITEKAKRPNAAWPTPFIVTILHCGNLWNIHLKGEWNLNAMFEKVA